MKKKDRHSGNRKHEIRHAASIPDVCDRYLLQGGNLHLNAKGTSLLAVQFIRFLRSSLSDGQFSKGRKSGFRMSLMKLLGETVKTIWEQTQGQH
jgi:hypothetical protein